MSPEERLIEGKALVESGDLVLENYRAKYREAHHRDCTLTDDQLIVVCMTPDDDQDDADWVQDMLAAEDALKPTDKTIAA